MTAFRSPKIAGAVALAVLLCGCATAPGPFEQCARLGRGVNLGNALEAPKEADWGVKLEEQYFHLIADAGFDSVRIPIRWSAHAASEPPYTIDPAFLARVDWAVEQALGHGLAAIINIHHYDELTKDPAGQKERFLGLWAQIADHYKGEPDTLLFEVLNEPHDALTPKLWNAYLADALRVIRATNPRRTVLIGTANWGGPGSLKDLVLPRQDRQLIVSFHYYAPFHFTHQGAEWVEGSQPWLGTTWRGTPEEQVAVLTDLDGAVRWAEERGRPLHMGEFGAYSKADMDSRARWTMFLARQAEERKISWAYWEFCAGFGVYDAKARSWRMPLLRALIPAGDWKSHHPGLR